MKVKALVASGSCAIVGDGRERVTKRSADVRDLWSAARLCPSRAFEMRVPVSRSRPLLRGGSFPVADRAAVGVLGLAGEGVLGAAGWGGAGGVGGAGLALAGGGPGGVVGGGGLLCGEGGA